MIYYNKAHKVSSKDIEVNEQLLIPLPETQWITLSFSKKKKKKGKEKEKRKKEKKNKSSFMNLGKGHKFLK